MPDKDLDSAIRKSISEESVDDILAGIINKDGSFNDEFNGLFARYLGMPTEDSDVGEYDLSDRNEDVLGDILAAADTPDPYDVSKDTVDAAISRRMGENAEAYENQMSRARRPNYTSSGSVRYPVVGTGESEERVVYDADWERSAKEEADRAFRYTHSNPYSNRPDERHFVAGGRELARDSYRPVIDQPSSPLVDPISDDDDFNRYWQMQYEQSRKKPFFQEGLRANQGRDKTARAEDRRDNTRSHKRPEAYASRSSDWLTVEQNKNKKNRKDRSAIPDADPLPRTVNGETLKSTEVIASKGPVSRLTYGPSEKAVKVNEADAKELRDTIAQIVDKYDRKSKEEELTRLKEEKEKAEREKQEAKQAAIASARLAKKLLGVSDDVSDAVRAEEKTGAGNDIFDDFSDDSEEGFDDF